MNMTSFTRIPARSRAFTLVETLVAITIVTLAILAPFDAIEKVVNASRLAKDNLIASALAEEMLEYVRFVRTTNYISHQTDLMQGLDGTNSPKFGDHDCTDILCSLDAAVNPTVAVNPVGATCSTNHPISCPNLYVTAQGLYTLVSTPPNTQTIFKRGFNIDVEPSGVGTASYETVTAQVTWEDHGTQKIILTESLYDWF